MMRAPRRRALVLPTRSSEGGGIVRDARVGARGWPESRVDELPEVRPSWAGDGGAARGDLLARRSVRSVAVVPPSREGWDRHGASIDGATR